MSKPKKKSRFLIVVHGASEDFVGERDDFDSACECAEDMIKNEDAEYEQSVIQLHTSGIPLNAHVYEIIRDWEITLTRKVEEVA